MLLASATTDRKRPRLQTFTIRELEVAQFLAEGMSNKGIARVLDRSVKTVESHRATAMRKAGVHSAAEFVRFAIKQNLIQA